MDAKHFGDRCRDPLPGRVHIALVDDDESVFAAINEMSRNEGWHLDHYPDGRSAMLRIPFNRPDVVLMDILMPGLSGIDCAKKLKCLAPDLPVVMLTASTDFED